MSHARADTNAGSTPRTGSQPAQIMLALRASLLLYTILEKRYEAVLTVGTWPSVMECCARKCRT
jgi:hypothetical protein